MTPDSAEIVLAKAFAEAIVARDFAAAERMLAPWLPAQLPDGSLKKFLRRAREDRPRPHSFDVSPNTAVTFEDLSQSLGSQPINPENFRAWLCVEFYPDPDLDSGVDLSYVLWIAVVSLQAELAVGHLEPDA